MLINDLITVLIFLIFPPFVEMVSELMIFENTDTLLIYRTDSRTN